MTMGKGGAPSWSPQMPPNKSTRGSRNSKLGHEIHAGQTPWSRPWELLDQAILNLLDLHRLYAHFKNERVQSKKGVAGLWIVRRTSDNDIVCYIDDNCTRDVDIWLETISKSL